MVVRGTKGDSSSNQCLYKPIMRALLLLQLGREEEPQSSWHPWLSGAALTTGGPFPKLPPLFPPPPIPPGPEHRSAPTSCTEQPRPCFHQPHPSLSLGLFIWLVQILQSDPPCCNMLHVPCFSRHGLVPGTGISACHTA